MMGKKNIFVLMLFFLFALSFSQTSDIYQFEREICNPGLCNTNPQLAALNNPAIIGASRHLGVAYYRGFFPAPGNNLFTGALGSGNCGLNVGLLFGDSFDKLYTAVAFGVRYFAVGASYKKGLGDFESFKFVDAGFQSDIGNLVKSRHTKLAFACNFKDIDTDKYARGFGALDFGFSTNALLQLLYLGFDASFSAGNNGFAKNVDVLLHAALEIPGLFLISGKYDISDETVSLGLDVGYNYVNLLFSGVVENNDFKKPDVNSFGIELSNRRLQKSTSARKWDWFNPETKPDIMLEKITQICPGTFDFLANKTFPTNEHIRNEIRNRYYSRRLKAGELSGAKSSISAGDNRSVAIFNIDASKHPQIALALAVTDMEGNFVSGLRTDDFFFPEDTLEIVSVEEISSENEIPVDIVFVIDESGSMFNDIKALRRKIHSFVDELENSGIDFRLGLVTYGDDVNRVHEPVGDVDAFDFWLSRKLKGGIMEVGEDAVAEACALELRTNSQKLVIIATDEYIFQGYGIHDACELLAMYFAKGISLYQIIDTKQNNAAFLSWFTLGRIYNIKRNFNSILDDLQKELAQKYIVTYTTFTAEAEFDLLEWAHEPISRQMSVKISGKVIDPDGNPVPAAIVWENLSTGKRVGEIRNAEDSGTYEIEFLEMLNYGYYAESEGYYSESGNLNLVGSEESRRIHHDIVMTPIKTLLERKEGFILKNIFFDFDSSSLKPESFPELDRLASFMTANPTIKIEIAGHTDSKGSDEYNLDLSDRRAHSVVEYLVSTGIDSGNLIAKGYGEIMPIATNDTDEGCALNRRVEFRIIND